jgi:hypothetical protein
MLVLLSLIACVTQENFNDQFATTVCQRTEECNKGGFDSAYDDVQECVDDLDPDGLNDAYEDCTFDAEAGAGCLKDIREADCEDFQALQWGSDCDDVWDCT